MDRLLKELHDCSKLAHDARNRDDRMFWERQAQRWKALIQEFEKPAIADEQKTTRPTRFQRRYGTSG
jgi:hypothetical protein